MLLSLLLATPLWLPLPGAEEPVRALEVQVTSHRFWEDVDVEAVDSCGPRLLIAHLRAGDVIIGPEGVQPRRLETTAAAVEVLHHAKVLRQDSSALLVFVDDGVPLRALIELVDGAAGVGFDAVTVSFFPEVIDGVRWRVGSREACEIAQRRRLRRLLHEALYDRRNLPERVPLLEQIQDAGCDVGAAAAR